jgi:ribosomal protein S18 acetylase RimI-like enzyme
MQFVSLPADEAAVRRFSEALWLPYNRTLEATVEGFALVDAPDEEILDEEVEFRLGRLEEESYRLWVAVDTDSETVDLAAGDGDFAGFVSTSVDEAPSVFDRPDRLVIGDIFVRDPYRGTGLADELLARARARAEAADCAELALDVDVDNERALAFYEKHGFELHRHRMHAPVDGS